MSAAAAIPGPGPGSGAIIASESDHNHDHNIHDNCSTLSDCQTLVINVQEPNSKSDPDSAAAKVTAAAVTVASSSSDSGSESESESTKMTLPCSSKLAKILQNDDAKRVLRILLSGIKSLLVAVILIATYSDEIDDVDNSFNRRGPSGLNCGGVSDTFNFFVFWFPVVLMIPILLAREVIWCDTSSMSIRSKIQRWVFWTPVSLSWAQSCGIISAAIDKSNAACAEDQGGVWWVTILFTSLMLIASCCNVKASLYWGAVCAIGYVIITIQGNGVAVWSGLIEVFLEGLETVTLT
jgi:hypothetical protein